MVMYSALPFHTLFSHTHTYTHTRMTHAHTAVPITSVRALCPVTLQQVEVKGEEIFTSLDLPRRREQEEDEGGGYQVGKERERVEEGGREGE